MNIDNNLKITVTGHTSLDYILNVNDFANKNESRPISSMNMYYGGGAANVAIALAKLKTKVKLLTPIGYDFYTTKYNDIMSELNIDISDSYIFNKEQLSKAFVITDKQQNQKTYFYWGVGSKLKLIEPKKENFVHISTANSTFNKKIALKSNFVSFDPGQDLITYNKEDLITILKNTDILFVNKYEQKLMCKILNQSFENLKKIIDPIVVTKDVEGSVLYTKKKEYKIPSIKTKAVDPTGAGDAYKAGFLASYINGYSLEICCKVGSVMASFVVESIGCQTNLPTKEELINRYNLYYKDLA